jgi:acyl-CoA synthetase (AMP-forming)/AMP-acid ligase II
VPDPDAGEAVVLAYDSFDHRPVDEDGLRRHLKDRLPYYAVPAVLRFFAQMPLTGNGKIAYAAVREIVVAERSGGKRDAAA